MSVAVNQVRFKVTTYNRLTDTGAGWRNQRHVKICARPKIASPLHALDHSNMTLESHTVMA